MQFPNAAKGVKKIYTAEILELISNIALLVAAVLALVALGSLGADSAGGFLAGGLGATVLGLGALVLGIIAFFMTLSGINAAKLDEPQFKNALIALVVGIALQIAASCFSNELVKSLCGSLGNACDLLVTIYIAKGVGALADKLSNAELSAKCQNFVKLLTGLWCVAIVLKAVGGFLKNNVATATIGGIIAIVALVVAIVAYFIFIGLLKKGAEMLNA